MAVEVETLGELVQTLTEFQHLQVEIRELFQRQVVVSR